MKTTLAALAALLFAASGAVLAQPTFQEVTPPTDPHFVTPAEEDFWVNAIAPADVDGDGDVDLAVIGYYVVYNESAEDRLVILLNQGAGAGGNWTFTHQPVPMGELASGASDLAWGDYDGDGDHDLVVGSQGLTRVFRNDSGVLVPTTIALPGYAEDSWGAITYDLRSIAWADADNDGDLDLLVPSVFDEVEFEYGTKLMRNDGSDGSGGWIFADTLAAIDPTVNGQTAWIDDDGDGDLDLFLTNVDPYADETPFVRRYRSEPTGFVREDLLGIRVEHGLSDWGDYDADGDLDILVVGNIMETDTTFTTILRVYRNDGSGVYTPNTLVQGWGADWNDLFAATWADYDSDGDVDILLTGTYIGDAEIIGRSGIFANDGGVFTELDLTLPAPVDALDGGAFAWLDLDGDGDLDYLVAGAYYVPDGNGLVEAQMHLYRNGAPAANAAPTAPGGLIATSAPGGVALSWNPAGDDDTPVAALTYDLELRPLGAPVPSAERLPQPGSVSAVTSWALTGLPAGSYAWTVRAVDSSLEGGPRSEGIFTVGGTLIFADGFESGNTSAWLSGPAP